MFLLRDFLTTKHTALHSLLSGLFLSLAFIVPFLWWFCIVGFVLLLTVVNNEQSYKTLFVWGLCIGTIQYASALSWFWNTYPVKWLPENDVFLQLTAIGSYWLITAFVMGSSVGLFAVVVKHLNKGVLVYFFSVPIFWIMHEALGALFFSLYTLGPGSSLNIYFGFGQTGYLFSQHTVLILGASLYGVYGLSYFGAVLSVSTYLFFHKKLYYVRRYTIVLITVCLGLVVSSDYIISEYAKKEKEVIVVETYIRGTYQMTDEEKRNKETFLHQAIAKALTANPDIILLPEDLRFADFFISHDELFSWIASKNPTFKGVLIDSGRFYNAPTQDIVLRTHMFENTNRTTAAFDKTYLVPQGEYLPYFYSAVLSLLLTDESFLAIKNGLLYRQGIQRDSTSFSKNLPAVLFCFESASPFGVRNALRARNPSSVVHVVSHALLSPPLVLNYAL